MAQSIAGYEASAEVTTFTSKFDAVQAGKAQFTQQEQAGYNLLRGKAQCNACHRDGGPGEDPLFTDFTASNIGTPANPQLPYYAEQRPDARGYVANPEGSSFVDLGVGGFLERAIRSAKPSSVDARWLTLARDNQARFQVPTLRNVDKRPYPTFVKGLTFNSGPFHCISNGEDPKSKEISWQRPFNLSLSNMPLRSGITYPTMDRTASKPRLSLRGPCGNRHIPPLVLARQSVL
jgi:hypothetical protein